MPRYLIIHGHFYQPPRENPWMLAIEPQESAAPFENWNTRINRECYAPNTCSRLLNERGQIKRLVNNYQYLSFNFGPTLLSWLKSADPDTYSRVVEADRAAAARHEGHGPALAQVYNHIIMPLATDRDRQTQVRWGIADFTARYGRKPEGLWLAETAVDLKTLEILAKEGIKFTVLSQTQGASVRPLAAKGARKKTAAAEWQDVSGGRIDPREPYRVFWGSGAKEYIDVFFYDGPVSRAIAFENLLSHGPAFLRRIEEAFGEPKEDGGPRLVNLATDGESYGHHFQYGDMALAWLFNHLEEREGNDNPIVLTNYGHYLAMFPPQKEARIVENSAWSCSHGVERWRSDCGCKTGGPGNQKWRAPLRNGLNRLGGQLAEIFEREAGKLVKDPWAARDDYINVFLNDYSEEAGAAFLKKHAPRDLSPAEALTLRKMLEAQLMGLFMFTSCGWFFDDISGLEPVRNLMYAMRAAQLAQPFAKNDLLEELLEYLAQITPNNPDFAGGLDIWRRLVAPDSLSGRALAAHWIAAEILEAPAALTSFAIPAFKKGPVTRLQGGGLDIMAGAVELYDRRLRQSSAYLCLAIYSGGTHLAILVDEAGEAGALPPAWLEPKALSEALGEELSPFATLSIWESMVRMMPQASRFVMDDLMPHIRTALLSAMVREVYDSLKSHTRDLFHVNQHLLMANRSSALSLNWVERFIFRVMGEAELTRILAPAATGRAVDMAALSHLLNRRGLVGIARDKATLSELSADFVERSFRALETSAEPRRILEEIAAFIRLIKAEGFAFDMWKSQNLWYGLMTNPLFLKRLSAEEADILRETGDLLGFAQIRPPR